MPLSGDRSWFETQQTMNAQYPPPPHLAPRRSSNTGERIIQPLQRGLSFMNMLTGGARLEREASVGGSSHDPHGKHAFPASEPHGKHDKHGKHVRVHPSVPSSDDLRHKEAQRRKASSEQADFRAASPRLQQEAVWRHLMPLEREREEPALLRRCAAASCTPQLTLTPTLTLTLTLTSLNLTPPLTPYKPQP